MRMASSSESKGNDHLDGAENFVLSQQMIGRDACEQRGREKMAAAWRIGGDGALRDNRQTVLASARDIGFDARFLRGGNQGADIEIVLGGADPQRAIAFAELFEQWLVNRLLDQKPRRRGTGLSRILDSGIHQEGQRPFQIGIRKDDLRRFSAQLQRHRARHFVRPRPAPARRPPSNR